MKLKQKLIATILTVMMLASYVATLTNAVIAVGENLANQNSRTNHTNVEFNSYFEGEEHSKTFEIGKEAKIYIKLKVSNTGYLKNGIVQFSNANFEIDSSLKNDKVQSGSKDKINLKQINNGEEIVIEVPITMTKEEKVDKDFLSKTSIVRLTGTYIDENGKERAIEKEISNQLKWMGTPEVVLEGEVSKYLPYQIENEKGVMVQVKIKSNLKDNLLPVEQTKLELSVPEITISEENIAKPTRITAIANSTAATNGKGDLEFNEENYNYNEETGKLEIHVENNEEDGKIAWNKKASDEYLVNFIYTGEEVYNHIQSKLEKAEETMLTEEEKKQGMLNENAITGEIEVNTEIITYNEKASFTKEGKIAYSIENSKGELIESKISTAKELSKGYIYSNYAKSENQAKDETNYTVNYTAKINDKTLVDEVEFNTANEEFVAKNDEKYNTKSENIYIKTIKISENNLRKILGEEGTITITDKEGNKLAQINNKTTKDEEGNYSLTIAEAKTNEISIKTSKILTEGNIEISVEKVITGVQSYTKDQMQLFESIETQVITKAYKTEEVQSESQELDNTNATSNESESQELDSTATESQEESKKEEKTIEILDKTSKAKINLIEPVSKAEVSIGTQNLSTIVENKDVEIRVVLDTSSNKNALYKNPVLQVILPENIEKLEIKSADLLLEDELKMKKPIIEEANGRKIIKVELTGTQTKYMDNQSQNEEQDNVISKGANIVIKANITFKKLTPSANSKIYLYYTNENTNLYEQYYKKSQTNVVRASISNSVKQNAVGVASTDITITSPNGVVAENRITGLKTNTEVSNITSDMQEVKINANTEANEVTIGGTIVNNYSNSIENVFILGRVPSNGMKQIDSEEKLESNFAITMKEKMAVTGIDASKVKVYYSTNPEATKSLIGEQNSWTEEPASLAEVKSYLIAIGGEVAQGTKISFNYKAEVPANLDYESATAITYKAYYDNNMPGAQLGESKLAGLIKLTTGQGPKIKVELKSGVTTAREGQIVKFTATVNNTGDQTIENAKLLITAPEGTVHTTNNKKTDYYYEDSKEKNKEISLGNIKAGETITESYELKIKEIDSAEKDIENVVRLTAKDITGEVKSEACNINVKEADLSIIGTNNYSEETIVNMSKIEYRAEVKNISNNKDLNNVIVTMPIPKNMKVEDVYYTYNTKTERIKENITTSSDAVTINLGTLKASKVEEADGETQKDANEETSEEGANGAKIILKLQSEGFNGTLDYVVTAKADGIEEINSNINTFVGKVSKLAIEAMPLDNTYIQESSKFTYRFVVTNTGSATAINPTVKAVIPEGVNFEQAVHTYKGNTVTTTIHLKESVKIGLPSIDPGDKIEIEISAKTNKINDGKNKDISISATVEAVGIEQIESNKVTAVIEYDENAHNQDSSWTQTPGENEEQASSKYKITGTVWIDANKNGQRDEDEELLQGVQVALLYKSDSQFVKEQSTGKEKITTTNEKGEYEFNNLTPNEYLVLFLYDAGKYSITDYQKEGVAQSINSDATGMKIVLNGEQRYAGVSNTIKITNSHVRDIDIGLFEAENFDLRLDKYISKITVTTPSNGTKVYNYNNSKLTKREIASKDVGNSMAVVEYKIVVTNEGRVAGYAKKIIDYLPSNVNFNSELNKDWYIADNNGAVYNTALENEKIEPGQSKEVKLILSFNITNKNIGTIINNNAEIYESYNEFGLEDVDSITANRLETDDDMSNADIVLSVATGTIILYTTLACAIIVLLGIGIYEIKSRVFSKK